MEHLIYFILAFVIAFFGRYLLYKRSKKANKKGRKSKKKEDNLAIEMKYLASKFKLNKEAIDTPNIAKVISLIDALIIAATCTLITFITEDMMLIFLLGVVLIFVLIYVIYEIIGKILIKKGFDKNGL